MPLRVDLDPIGALLDQVLAHPAAAALEATLPGATARVRAIRDNLPEVASGLEARALAHVGRELDRAVSGALDRWLRPRTKRLRAKKRKAKPKQLGGKR